MSAMPLRVPARQDPTPLRRPWHEEGGARVRLGRLRVVRAPSQARSRVPFVALCVALLAGSLLAALLLNTSMAQTSFAIHESQIKLARLTEREQDLAQRAQAAASPQALAQRARAAGMVPAPPPAFLRLEDGTIIGEPVPASQR